MPPSQAPPSTDQKTEDAAPIPPVYAGIEQATASVSNGLSVQEIFNAHARYLWRALLGLGVPERDVDDACQEVFLVVHRRLADIEPSTLKSWLYGVCLRVASGHRRKLRDRRELPVEQLPELPVTETPFERAAAVQLQDELLQILEQLDENRRAAFVLYEIEELTLKEVALALECPLQTAYSRLEAARSHVRRAFERRGAS
jgi:RNA polymerase sigma-70 factor, ECF subfamily